MSPKYRTDIDGMRAIAVLSILTFHLDHNWLSGGFIGVDIFFVISGYLITTIIVSDTEKRKFYFSNFYARRIRRIFPALFVCLIGTAIAAWAILPVAEYESFFKDFKYAVAQASNFRFMQAVDYMDVGIRVSPLLHTWSLAVEEQFYLFWPLFITAIMTIASKSTLKKMMLGGFAASLLTCQYFLLTGESELAFYMFFTRAFEFIIGSLVYLYPLQRLTNQFFRHCISVVGGSMIACALVFYSNETIFPGVSALLPVIGAALLIYSGSDGKYGVINLVLSTKPLVWIGLISYSLYLWHWPLVSFTQGITGNHLTNGQAIAIAFASFILAQLSYVYVEKPFRQKSEKTPTSRCLTNTTKTIVSGFSAIVVMIVVGQQLGVQSQWFGRAYADLMLVDAHRNAAPSTLACSNGEELQEGADVKGFVECVFKRHEGMTDVILVGDSHAMYFKNAGEEWSKSQGLSFQDFGISGCPMLFDAYSYANIGNSEIHVEICSQLSREIGRYIRNARLKPRYIFIANRDDLTLPLNSTRVLKLDLETPGQLSNVDKQVEAYKRTVRYLKALGDIKVILVGQATLLKESPFECLDKQQVIPMYFAFGLSTDCPENIVPSDNQKLLDAFHEKIQELAASTENVKYFGIHQHIQSLYDSQGRLLYRDDDHISLFGANFLIPYLMEDLKEISVRSESSSNLK